MAVGLKDVPARVRFEPWPEFLRRHWPAVPIGVLAAAAAFVGATIVFDGSTTDGDRIDIRFGLTAEVAWPFYDPARERLARTVADAAFVTEVEAAATSAGGELLGIDTDTESGVAFVDVVVRASTPDAAAAVADLVTTRVPEVDAEALTRAEQQDLEQLMAAANATEVRLADYETQIAALLDIELAAMEVLAEGFDPAAETRRLAAENERRALGSAADEASRELSRQLGDVAELEAALETVRNESEVLSVVASTSGDDDSPVVPLVAAVAAALAATTASLWFTRRHSRVTSPWQIRDGEGLPLLGFASDGDDGVVVATVAAQLRADASGHPGPRTIAFTGGARAPLPEVAEGVASRLRTAGLDVEVRDQSAITMGTDGSTTIVPIAVDGPDASFVGAVDRVIVVVRHGTDRVSDLRSVVDAVRDRGGDVDGVCVVS